MAPITLQYSGMAGMVAISSGGGPNGGFGFTASGEAASSSADSMVAPELGSPIAEAAIGSLSAAHACAGSSGFDNCVAHAASNNAEVTAENRFMFSPP